MKLDQGFTLEELERLGGDEFRHAPEWWRDPYDVPRSIERWPLRRECSTAYRARRTSGTRSVREIGLLVVHCTQGDTAHGAASWFANPAAQGSAHVVVDAIECYRTLPPSAIPWGAPGANARGWHLELAGFAEWTSAEWRSRPWLLKRAAFKLAWHARAFDVPLRKLTVAELRAGERGVIDHLTATRAFGGTHTDPGVDFPWSEFMTQAHTFRGGLTP